MKTPLNWRLLKLKDVTTESQRHATKGNKAGLSVFGVNNQIGLTTTTRYHAESLERYKIIEPGMFAYNPMRLNIGSIGFCTDDFGIGLVSPDYVVFRCKEKEIEPKYLYYCIQSHHWKHWMSRAGAGSVRIRIYYEDIGAYPILLPPRSEQQRIAQILTTWDNAISLTSELAASKKQVKKGIAQQVLTGKKRFNEYQSKEWESVKLSDAVKIVIGRTPPRNNLSYWDEEKSTENIWLSISDLQSKYIKDSKEYLSDSGVQVSKARALPKNTVVMSFKLTIGKVGILSRSAYTNEAICALFPKSKSRLSFRYLYHALSAVNFDAEIDPAVKGKTLNIPKIERLILPLPTIGEQNKIADFMDMLDNEIELLNQKLNALEQQKKSLLQKLLTGQVRVKV